MPNPVGRKLTASADLLEPSMTHTRQSGPFDALIRVLLPIIGGFIGLMIASVALLLVLLLGGQLPFVQELFPFWWVFVGTSVLAGLVIGVVAPTRFWRPRRCGTCAYNLTANTSGRCPECGSPV